MATSYAEAPAATPAPKKIEPARVAVIGAAHPLTGGVAPFNEAMVRALRRRGPVEFLSWNRLYPPLLHRGEALDLSPPPPGSEPAPRLLDWHDPRTWRRALARIERFEADILVLPWLHPVMAPPYRWILRHAPKTVARVVICHNVQLHERLRGAGPLTRATLRHADLLVTHGAQQKGELAALGLAHIQVLEAFLPILVANDLSAPVTDEARRAERSRLGDPALVLLTFGAVRPYKGVDLAIEAMALVPETLDVKLVIAGKFWRDPAPFHERIAELGLHGRVEIHDGYQPNDVTALRLAAADAVLLPYRSASQSGVVSLAFSHDRPAIATRVGGLPQAIRDGVDGVLCDAVDPTAIARAIERFAEDPARLRAGVAEVQARRSFGRYAAMIEAAAHAR